MAPELCLPDLALWLICIRIEATDDGKCRSTPTVTIATYRNRFLHLMSKSRWRCRCKSEFALLDLFWQLPCEGSIWVFVGACCLRNPLTVAVHILEKK